MSHTPFAVMNATVNRPLALLLRSPLHGVASRSLLLISVTGRRTGRVHTLPVMYREAADGVLTIGVAAPADKRWWRNLRGDGAAVRVRLRGRDRTGRAIARGDENAGVTVEVRLEDARR
jgi:hypothetical protein